jgi:hypothetical protein
LGWSSASAIGLRAIASASSSRVRAITSVSTPKSRAMSFSISRATLSGALPLVSTTLPLCSSVCTSS